MMRRLDAFAWSGGVAGACCAASPNVNNAASATAPVILMDTFIRRQLLWPGWLGRGGIIAF
jgi:hypothetical protein